MKSDEFMQLVQAGKMEFKNGTTINCTLQMEKRMSSDDKTVRDAFLETVMQQLESGDPPATKT